MERSDSPNANPPSEATMSIKSIRGLRNYYPSDKGPIDTYQLGKNGRVEYLAAEISVDHITKGKDTSSEWHKWARERGVASDEAGLILSHRLGGSGIDEVNLFPKSKLLDDTTWKQHEEEAVEEASEMKKWKKIKFSVRLDYPTEQSTRPSALEYQYDLPNGSILYGKVNNTPAPCTQADTESEQAEEEEEEEEEEAEEEEEEEEEVAEEETAIEGKFSVQLTKAEPKSEAIAESQGVQKEEPADIPESPIKTVVQPPTPRPSLAESSPPREVIIEPPKPTPPKQELPTEPTNAAPVIKEEPASNDPSEETKKGQTPNGENSRTVLTKSDLIDLLPVIGSCKLAYETVQAVFNGNGRMALRKAVQCGISLVADFYLARAIARHGKILGNSVTEETVIRFVTKAENQIIITTTFKATNQILSTLTRVLS